MWFHEAKRIYVVPIGKIQWWLLTEIKDHVQATFGKETVIAEEISMPMELVNKARGQIHSTKLIELLIRQNHDGMALSVIDYDLYVPGLNFVFGEADPSEGMAVISITRLKNEFYGGEIDQALLLERALKEAVHEIGHLYGLRHCPDPKCVMHFSNSITDTDIKTKEFCSLCRSMLESVEG